MTSQADTEARERVGTDSPEGALRLALSHASVFQSGIRGQRTAVELRREALSL